MSSRKHQPAVHSRGDWRHPLAALVLPMLAAVVLLFSGCAGGTGNCVATYEFEGTVVKEGYTQSECEEECATIGRTLECFFEGRAASPMEATDRRVFVSGR